MRGELSASGWAAGATAKGCWKGGPGGWLIGSGCWGAAAPAHTSVHARVRLSSRGVTASRSPASLSAYSDAHEYKAVVTGGSGSPCLAVLLTPYVVGKALGRHGTNDVQDDAAALPESARITEPSETQRRWPPALCGCYDAGACADSQHGGGAGGPATLQNHAASLAAGTIPIRRSTWKLHRCPPLARVSGHSALSSMQEAASTFVSPYPKRALPGRTAPHSLTH